jgi:type VI secretion system secreted protein Hcp
MAAVDYFLQVDGVTGESTDAQFAGSIEVESFSWGATQAIAISGGGGATAAKLSVTEFSVVKRVDSASPQLLLKCATGKHIARVRLLARRSNPGVVFLQYELKDVLISSFKDAGTEGELPLEEVSFHFDGLQMSYVPVVNGRPGDPIVTSIDTRFA